MSDIGGEDGEDPLDMTGDVIDPVNEPRPDVTSPPYDPDEEYDHGDNEPRPDSVSPTADGPPILDGDEYDDDGDLERSITLPPGEWSPDGTVGLPVGRNHDSAMEEDDPDAEGELDEEDEDNADIMEELQERYDQLHELYERALADNRGLQTDVIKRKMQDNRSFDASEKTSEGKVTEHKYQNLLRNVHEVRLKLRLQQVKAARVSDELKHQLEAKRAKAIECRNAFQDFKRQMALNAEYARTGKKIPERIIQEVEEFELDKDSEVEEVRGSNISLKNRLSKVEQQLREKDKLAENLHVIDFERLKIENQTLNEKIEERNDELHKLRKKTVITVTIITHMREKVQFVTQEYQALKAELAKLDQDLAEQRDIVARAKHERDEHRLDHAKLKQVTGIMNSENLAKDYDTRKAHIEKLHDDIADLQKRHKQMTAFIKKHTMNST